jgi:hypothetical protein
MHTTTRDRTIALVVGVTVFALAACGATSSSSGSPSLGGSPSKSDAATNSPLPKADPLEGIWQSDPITAADVDAAVRPQFSGSAVDAWERHQGLPHGCSPKAGQSVVAVLHFDGGQLVISFAVNGGSAREGWTGSYVAEDSDTFKAGGDDLYITVDFKIRGDRLFTHLIKDNFPDRTPWTDAQDGSGMSKLNGVVGKPMSDTMCQIALYETTRFTRIG